MPNAITFSAIPSISKGTTVAAVFADPPSPIETTLTPVCAIEFAEKQRAQCALSYGNSSQPGSIHQEDQLPLLVEKRLHPVWRERADIEKNLEKREAF